MAEIRIEGKDAAGPYGGHLYLVFVSDSGAEFVIRGGPTYQFPPFGSIVVEAGVSIVNSDDNRPIADRADHGSRVLDLGGRDANDVWEAMKQSASLIGAKNISYDATTQNSNSTISAVLADVNIVVGLNLPYPNISIPSGIYPAHVNDLSDEYERIFLAEHTSENDDQLNGGDLDDVFVLGSGDDVLWTRGGDDLLIGDQGNDQLDGGDDNDTADYSGSENSADSSGTTGITAAITVGSSSTLTATVIDNWGGTDSLQNIESIIGTAQEDVFAANGDIVDLAANLVALDAGSSPNGTGDTVDFSGLTGTSSLFVDLSADAAGDFDGGILGDTFEAIGFENVIGSEFDDTITGNASNNILVGGDGVDQVDGGAGDDILIIDSADTDYATDLFPLGGEGYDIAYVTGGVGIELDMDFAELEVVVGGAGDDEIGVFGDGTNTVMAAGGDGDDTFSIDSGGGTAVVWGGKGADYYYFGSTAKIMTVTVAGLTTENFAEFDLDMLGLGASFDWSNIDAVVVNPDSSDRFFINDEATGTDEAIGTKEETYEIWDSPGSTFPVDPAPFVDEPREKIGAVGMTVTQRSYEHYLEVLSGSFGLPGNEANDAGTASNAFKATGVFEAAFLGSSIATLQTYVDTNLDVSLTSEAGVDASLHVTLTFEEEGYTYEFDNYYYVKFHSPSGEPWVNSLGEVQSFSNVNQVGDWFVAGGSFNGASLVSSSSIVAVMPNAEGEDTVFDWLNSVTASSGLENQTDTTNSSAQAGSSGSDSFQVNTGEGTTLVSGFDIDNDIVEIDEVVVDPSAPPAGAMISQSGANAVIQYGTSDQIVLVGIDTTQWMAATSTITVDGTTGNDVIDGSYVDIDGESISAGGQTILGGDGNDSIYDGSGDDVVDGGEGSDLFYAGDGADQYIGGAGQDELFYTTALVGLTIDTINGANSTGIAAGDTFSGIEVLHGSNFDDVIKSGAEDILGKSGNDQFLDIAGNQNFYGGSGNDTFTYLSGNDVIQGFNSNFGTDTLDLSIYTSDRVSFSVSDHDVLIATPDGVIELDYQVGNLIGSNKSNIEVLLFSNATLTEQDIRDRAIADQSSAGNDIITGTSFDDVISSGAGDDIITGNGGDDTFIFTSGNDVIQGFKSNYGTDTLDLSIYTSDQVSFSVSGYDVLIATPDGVIELDNQVRNPVGDTKSNIEILHFADITMDEQGIYDAII